MTILFDVDERGVGRLKLNRPDVRNAMNGEMMQAIATVFRDLDPSVRVVVISGEGSVFSAGADLNWMRESVESGADTAALVKLFEAIDNAPVPVVVAARGAAIAGAAGLVAAADIAVAEQGCVFGFTEVRLGLVPAVISPYVMRKTGYAFARAAFLTAERFDAVRAAHVGLIHNVAKEGELEAVVEKVIEDLLLGAPSALIEARKIVNSVWGRSPSEATKLTSAAITARRASEEGQEGMTAFLERRPPKWAPK